MNSKGFFLILVFLISAVAARGSLVQTNHVSVTIQQTQQPKIEFRGLDYGPFRGVGPDNLEVVSKENIQEDMQMLQTLGVNQIRTYGIGLGLNQIPAIAHQYGITTATGTWINPGNDNYKEIDSALEAESVSSMVVVGNEVLTGNVGFTEDDLIGFVQYAQNQRTNSSFPIATAEEWLHFEKNNSQTFQLEPTKIGNAVDIIIMHAHPSWHHIPLAEAANWTISKYLEVASLYSNKTVILGETGWPSESKPANALFTTANQAKFYSDLLPLIQKYNVSSYLFDAFDENWKSGELYDGQYSIGQYWGIIEEKRYGKPAAAVVAEYFGGTISTDAPPAVDPTINSPGDKILAVGDTALITWIITDADTPEGQYTIYRNDVVQGVENLTWNSGSPIN